MANLSSNTNLTIPRGAVVKFGLGGIGQVIDESGTYKLGNQEVILGPYPVAKTITVLVQSTVRYVIDTDGVIDTVVPLDPITPSLTSPAAQEAVRAAVGSLIESPLSLYDGQPLSITAPVKKPGRLAATFSANWSVELGSMTAAQSSGYAADGSVSGIPSRTGLPSMLKVTANTNSTQRIRLTGASTNMLARDLKGKFGLWVYLEAPAGTTTVAPGGISVCISTGAFSDGNALLVSFTANQIRAGWNFLTFVQRNPAAYLKSGAEVEYHPFGVSCTSYGTGADTNIVDSLVNYIYIEWGSNLNGWNLHFDSIWTDFESKTQVVLGHDGGSNVTLCFDKMDEYGWVGYSALAYRIYSSGSTIISDLNSNTSVDGLAFYDRGWDQINHSLNHRDNGALTDPAEVAYEVTMARAWQLANDRPRGAEFYASPVSGTSQLAEKVIAEAGFRLQRHARHWNVQVTPLGIDNPRSVGAFDLGHSTATGVSSVTAGVSGSVAGMQRASKIKRAVDVAVAYGCAFFPFWHGITTTGDTGTGENATGDDLLLTKSAFDLSMDHIRQYELAGQIEVCRGVTGFYYGQGAWK